MEYFESILMGSLEDFRTIDTLPKISNKSKSKLIVVSLPLGYDTTNQHLVLGYTEVSRQGETFNPGAKS